MKTWITVLEASSYKHCSLRASFPLISHTDLQGQEVGSLARSLASRGSLRSPYTIMSVITGYKMVTTHHG